MECPVDLPLERASPHTTPSLCDGLISADSIFSSTTFLCVLKKKIRVVLSFFIVQHVQDGHKLRLHLMLSVFHFMARSFVQVAWTGACELLFSEWNRYECAVSR